MVHLLYLFLSEQHREPYNWCYANCITSTKIWRQYVCFGQYAKWNVFHTAFSVTRCFTLYEIVQHFCSLLLTQIEKKGQHFKENILSQIFPFFFSAMNEAGNMVNLGQMEGNLSYQDPEKQDTERPSHKRHKILTKTTKTRNTE